VAGAGAERCLEIRTYSIRKIHEQFLLLLTQCISLRFMHQPNHILTFHASTKPYPYVSCINQTISFRFMHQPNHILTFHASTKPYPYVSCINQTISVRFMPQPNHILTFHASTKPYPYVSCINQTISLRFMHQPNDEFNKIQFITSIKIYKFRHGGVHRQGVLHKWYVSPKC